MLEDSKGIQITGIGRDVIGVGISGSGNIIGKDISVGSGSLIKINNEQLEKIPQEYANALRDFSESINKQIKTHGITQLHVAQIQESVDELVKETEDVKSNQEIGISKKIEIRTKFANIAKNVLKVLPKTAETLAAFTPLSPFSRLIGEGTQYLVEAIQKEV